MVYKLFEKASPAEKYLQHLDCKYFFFLVLSHLFISFPSSRVKLDPPKHARLVCFICNHCWEKGFEGREEKLIRIVKKVQMFTFVSVQENSELCLCSACPV